MSSANRRSGPDSGQGLVSSLLSLDQLVTGKIVHLVYWVGLGLVLMVGFSFVGSAFGLAMRGGEWDNWLLAFGVLIAGLAIMAVLGLLWRSFCEFYIAVFRISEDLHALRLTAQAEARVSPETIQRQMDRRPLG
jgi:hypothetical protein